MSDTGPEACARAACGKVIAAGKALMFNDLPYCSKFCLIADAKSAAENVVLEENES